MEIVNLKQEKLAKTARLVKNVLKKDGLVILPTDTAYGLAANAESSLAVKKILNFKGKRFGKGISIFLKNIAEVENYCSFRPDQKQLIETLLPGPFTVILKSKGKTTPEIEPEDKTVGIRIINHLFVKKLTSICPFAITATSANLSGKGPHYSVESFLKTLSAKKKVEIDLIINAGSLTKKPTSTVVRLVDDEIKVLRTGTLDLKLKGRFSTKNAKETRSKAKGIYQRFFKKELNKKSVLVILKGDLGAGKTVFAKGIGEIFNQELVSPTFTLMDEYQINQPPVKNLYHLDLYRIEEEKEIIELGIEKLLEKGNLVLIEWGEKLSILESLKKESVSFFLIQIEVKKNEERGFSFYRI